MQEKFTKDGKGSVIGLGAIPPQADNRVLDGVAVKDTIRIHVLSFATLRTFRFGKGAEGDEAIRVLIAAALLRAMAGSNAELALRTNCHFNEADKPQMVLDKRFGVKEELDPLTVEAAESLLEEAYAYAQEKAGVAWNGQVLTVQGNAEVLNNGSADEAEEK